MSVNGHICPACTNDSTVVQFEELRDGSLRCSGCGHVQRPGEWQREAGQPTLQGWMARLPAEQQKAFMDGMIRAALATQQLKQTGDLGLLEISAVDALDSGSWAEMLRSNAFHVRRQAALLEEVAQQYDELARIAGGAG